MKVTIRNLEQQLKALANARRLGMLAYLKKGGDATVGDIAGAVRSSIQTASQHLRILKAAGVVEYKRRAKYVTYRLSLKQEEPVKKILALL
ncbi:MAG: metalloregulator ArsR/SmtB family transcription factor [Patescibacteria group bacterium]